MSSPLRRITLKDLSWSIHQTKSYEEKMHLLYDFARRSSAELELASMEQPICWELMEDGVSIGCFLIDENNPTVFGPVPVPVCGKIDSRGRVCTNGRGYKTGHPGFGLCRFCEKKTERAVIRGGNPTVSAMKPLSGNNQKMHLLNRQNRVPSRLAECLVAAEEIEEGVMKKVDTDIQMMYGLIQYVMEGGLQEIEEADRDAGNFRLRTEEIKILNTMFKSVLDAKKTRHAMENEMRLDPVTIKAFVSQVLAIVFANTDARMARKIGAEILDKVIRPFRSDGKLAGHDSDYEAVGSSMVDAIVQHSGVDRSEVEALEGTPVEETPMSGRDASALVADIRSRVRGAHDQATSTGIGVSDTTARRAARKMEKRKKEMPV